MTITTLRGDLQRHVERKEKQELHDLEKIIIRVKGSTEGLIAKKMILRVPNDKEENDLTQITSNLDLVRHSITLIK